jgi:phosphatidate cytidylyltransferase
LSQRLKTALVAGPICVALLLFGGTIGFGFLVAVIAAVGAAEYAKIAHPGVTAVEVSFLAGWAVVVVLGFLAASHAVPGALLVLGALLYLGGWIVGPGPTKETLGRWGAALGGWIFVAYFLGHALWIRGHGVAPVLYILAIVWVGDSAAYYVGSAFGSRPLAPSVSPNKSVEGAVASLVGGALAAGIAGLVLPLPRPFYASLVMGVILNAVAQLGDLAESLFKRCADVKDSGTLFPGHGGVLDRIDGFLLTLPVYAAFLTLAGA